MQTLLSRINRRTFLQYLLSFFALLFVSIICSTLISFISYRHLETECQISNYNRVVQLAELYDTLLDSTDDILLKLESNHSFVYAISAESKNETISQALRYEIHELLDWSFQANQADMFIYFIQNDYVISAKNSTTDSKTYYRAYYNDARMDYAQWQDFLNINTSTRLVTMYYNGDPCLAIVRSLPTYYRNRVSSVVAVSVFNTNIISAISSSLRDNSGLVAICSQDMKPFVSSNPQLVSQITFPESIPTDKYLSIKVNGIPYFMYVVDSKVEPCRYISLTPEYDLSPNLITLRYFQWGTIILLTIGGALFAYYLATKNVKPVEEAAQLLSQKTNTSLIQHRTTEMDYIKSVILQTIDERDNLLHTFNKHEDVLHQNFLYEAVYGLLPETDDCIALFAKNGIQLQTSRFAVALLQNWHDEKIDHSVLDTWFSYVKAKNVLCFPIYIQEPACIVVLNLPQNAEPALLDTICQRSLLPEPIIFCRSDAFSCLDGLHQAYKQVTKLYKYGVVYADTITITPAVDTQQSRFASHPNFSSIAEKELVRAIKDQDIDCLNIFCELQKQYSDTPLLHPVSVRCFMYEMRSYILAAITRQCSTAYLSEVSIPPAFNNCDTLPWFRHAAVRFLELAQKKYTANHSDNNLCAQVLKYLDDNYSDSSLGVGTLDQKFGVTSAYLSERFRTHTGQSIPDYLTNVRIVHACELLSGTTMNLEEIAEKVGIVGSSTFIRLFKKCRGITPGAYRKTYGLHSGTKADAEN